MSGRTGMSTGVGVTLGVLSLLTVGFGVGLGVVYSWYADGQQQLVQMRSDMNDIARTGESNTDAVRSLINEAKKSGNKSLVAYMTEQMGTVMQNVTGSRTTSFGALKSRLETIEEAKNGTPLLNILANRDSEVAQLKRLSEKAKGDLEAALTNQKNEVARVNNLESEYKATVAALNAKVDGYQNEIENYRKGADDYKAKLDKMVEAMKADWANKEKGLNDRIASLTNENLVARNQIAALRGERTKELLRGKDEFALVDGSVVGVDAGERKAFINIGEKQKVQIGMTFTVYPDANAIRPDDNGNYPRGKATLEVINVGENTSTCLVTSESRGTPVINGDVIANAVFDPNKVYKFIIEGNFDANRDGFSTALEKRDLESLVNAWGGRLAADLTADVDFLVVGERPILPPQPPADAPQEVFLEFIRQQKLVQRYDQVVDQATRAGVPIVNENRFYTLIGKTPAAIRATSR